MSKSEPSPTTSSPAKLPRDERDALFDKLVELAPVFGDYQAKTSRIIPLFELHKA